MVTTMFPINEQVQHPGITSSPTAQSSCIRTDSSRQHRSVSTSIASLAAVLMCLHLPAAIHAASVGENLKAAATAFATSQVVATQHGGYASLQDDRRSKRNQRSSELEILPGHHDSQPEKETVPAPGVAAGGHAPASDSAADAEGAGHSAIRTLVVRNDPLTGKLVVDVTSDVTVRGASYDEIEELIFKRVENRSVRLVDETGTSIRLIPRTRLGAVLKPVSGALASQLRLQDGEGLLIERIQPGLPAERAGLRQHDILVAADGRRPLTQQRLTELLATSDVGDVVSIIALRGGSEIEVHAALTENAVTVRDNLQVSRDLQLFAPTPPIPPRTPNPSDEDPADQTSLYAGTVFPPHLFPSPGANWSSESVIIEHRADEGGNRQIEWMERKPLTLSMLMNSGTTTAPLVGGQASKADIEALNARLDRIEDLLEVLLQTSSATAGASPTSSSSSAKSPNSP